MPQSMAIGSPAHKELFCRFFMDTHVPFEPSQISWPALDADSMMRLRRLPFWAEAVTTERLTACTIQARARLEPDPLLHDALTLQGYEEARHATLLQDLTTRYGIAVPAPGDLQPPSDAEWAFLCTGYSECFDAFFSFALLAIARGTGFFPPALIDLFEPIMQEEARHILFFVNWEAYCQAQYPWWQRPRHLWRGALGRGLQVWHRLQMARGMQPQGDFTITGHQTMHSAITPRGFLELCLQENERRFGAYDSRLLRPRLVPTLARTLCRLLPP